MNNLNCFGDFCPIPLLKAQKEVKDLLPGESLLVVTDHSCVVESLEEYFNLRHYKLSSEEVINGVWEITITKLL
jgi:tRNA 2-thiouridine synthesizing protein A